MPLIKVKAEISVSAKGLPCPCRLDMIRAAERLENVNKIDFAGGNLIIGVDVDCLDAETDISRFASMTISDWWEWMGLGSISAVMELVDVFGFTLTGDGNSLTGVVDGKTVVVESVGRRLDDETEVHCSISFPEGDGKVDDVVVWLHSLLSENGGDEEDGPHYSLRGYETAVDFERRNFVPLENGLEDEITACAVAGAYVGSGDYALVKVEDDLGEFSELFSAEDLTPRIDSIRVGGPESVKPGAGPFFVYGTMSVGGNAELLAGDIATRDEAIIAAGVHIATGKWNFVVIEGAGVIPMIVAKDGAAAPEGAVCVDVPIGFMNEAADMMHDALRSLDGNFDRREVGKALVAGLRLAGRVVSY